VSEVIIQPCGYTTPALFFGWQKGVPATPGAPTIPPIAGIKSNARNVFGDSPPIGREIYFVTSLQIAYYSLINPDADSFPDSMPVQTELTIYRGTDLIWTGIDSQVAQPLPEADAPFGLASGVFSADLVNPVAYAAGDTMSLQVGISAGPSVGLNENTVIGLGAQATAQPDVGIVYQSFPSSITYNLLKRQS
jgi:hypothetical protein